MTEKSSRSSHLRSRNLCFCLKNDGNDQLIFKIVGGSFSFDRLINQSLQLYSLILTKPFYLIFPSRTKWSQFIHHADIKSLCCCLFPFFNWVCHYSSLLIKLFGCLQYCNHICDCLYLSFKPQVGWNTSHSFTCSSNTANHKIIELHLLTKLSSFI